MASAISTAMAEAHKVEVDIIGSEGKKSLTGNDSSTFGGKTQKTLTAQLKKMVGIDVGVGALLKQSQIFTGYLGNLFAIVGALIDTILAPLAPLAFKSLAKLGAIIPKLADMAAKYIPKIVDFVGKIFLNVDKFFKSFLQKDYAGKILRGLLALIGINIGIRMLLLTGKAGGTILGLRQGGALNMAYRGGSRLLGAGGGGGGIGRIGSGLMAPVAATAAFGSRLFGRGGGSTGAGGTTTGGGGGGFMGRLFGRGGAPSQAPVWDANVKRWRTPAGAPGAGQFVAGQPSPGGTRGAGIMGKLGKVGKVPILGSALAAFSGYQGGREQGMSQGLSVGRGATVAATTFGGIKIGTAIGTAIAPGIGTAIGAVLGGLAGFAGGSGVFDAVFGKKDDKGFNMDLAGQIGASGYQAPYFLAEAQEYWSDQIRKDGHVIDDHAIALEVAKKMLEAEALAREKGIEGMEKWSNSFTDGTILPEEFFVGDAPETVEEKQARLDNEAARKKQQQDDADQARRDAEAQDAADLDKGEIKDFEQAALGEFRDRREWERENQALVRADQEAKRKVALLEMEEQDDMWGPGSKNAQGMGAYAATFGAGSSWMDDAFDLGLDDEDAWEQIEAQKDLLNEWKSIQTQNVAGGILTDRLIADAANAMLGEEGDPDYKYGQLGFEFLSKERAIEEGLDPAEQRWKKHELETMLADVKEEEMAMGEAQDYGERFGPFNVPAYVPQAPEPIPEVYIPPPTVQQEADVFEHMAQTLFKPETIVNIKLETLEKVKPVSEKIADVYVAPTWASDPWAD